MLKAVLFRVILALILILSLEAIGYIGIRLHSRSFDFLSNQSYSHIRSMLMGNTDPKMSPRYLSLPHLGYVPYPGYQKYGVEQHNEDGYRGHRVPRENDGKYRVLCMGGSTTYGFGVDSPWKTYPARLEKLLSNYISHDSLLSRKYSGAEVINAGIDGGTSAEELQQYLFKYRYYHANAVVVHSGINDAMLTCGSPPDLQLDYTDSRRLNFHLEPLAQPARSMMHSYFFSLIVIRLFYSKFVYNGGHDIFQHNGSQTFIKWSHINLDSVIAKKQYEDYAFYKNSKTLFAEITADSSVLVVLPNFLNDNSNLVKSSSRYAALNSLNVSLSKSLSDECKGVSVPFNFDDMRDSSYWVGDDCHVTDKGEIVKANAIFTHLKKEIR